MIFTEPFVMFVYLPLVLALFFLPGVMRVRLALVVAVSFVFYEMSSGGRSTLLLLFLSAWVYAFSGREAIKGNRALLLAAIAAPLTALLWYKYKDFLTSLATLDGSELGRPWSRTALPVGISFYVFHLVSFAIDRYRGDWRSVPHPLKFICYIVFFPQLVAGPITRYRQVSDGINGLNSFRPDWGRLTLGLQFFVVGMLCKTMLADTIGKATAPLIADVTGLGPEGSAFLILGYSLQIYFDFYGYSMMAMGLGEVFGIRLPANFNRPYLAANPKDFWRRWHISLSQWIRDYVYIPLGGNKRYALNLAIVFIIFGLWHGAGLNFALWGLYQAALVIAYDRGRKYFDRLPAAVRIATTFTAVSFGWLLFILDAPQVGMVIAQLAATEGSRTISLWHWGMVGLGMVVAFRVDTDALARNLPTSRGLRIAKGLALGALAAAALTLVDRSEPFIYFQF